MAGTGAPSLPTLYRQLVERYPEAPQVDRARRIIAALDERLAARAVADSTSGDSPTADTTAVGADTSAAALDLGPGETPADVEETEPARTTPPVDEPAPEQPERGADPQAVDPQAVDPSASNPEPTSPELAEDSPVADSSRAASAPAVSPPAERTVWTIVVGSSEEEAEAEEIVERYAALLEEEGIGVRAYPGETRTGMRYRIGIGQFDNHEVAAAEAERFAQAFAGAWPDDAWVLRTRTTVDD